MNRLIGGATALILATLAIPVASHADSNFTTGTGTITASAHLNFTVVIPQFVYARVSSGATMAANGTIDTVTYTVPAASVGQGAFAATAGGDISPGVVSAQVIGNGGTVTFTATTAGPLSNGVAGQTISYAQMTSAATADAALPSLALLPAFTLVDGGTASQTLGATAGVTNDSAKWTFTYANANIVAAGTYGATVANNEQVTYTASMP